MNEINPIMKQIADSLSQVGGIQAVVLGGSRARGTNTPSSDLDIGIYYDADALDLDALNRAAKEMDDQHRENLITPPGGWGEWVNGGGWLVVGGWPVDFILRDLARVKEITQESRKGDVTAHYQTGHPHAFINVMYMGELAVCKVLWEKDNAISALKHLAEIYPDPLQKTLIRMFSFEAEFSLWLAEGSLEQDDGYYVAAHIVRSVSALNQVLFALNREFLLNEKRAVNMIGSFATGPAGYKEKVDGIFTAVGSDNRSACKLLRALAGEVKALLATEQTGNVAQTIGNLAESKGSHADL